MRYALALLVAVATGSTALAGWRQVRLFQAKVETIEVRNFEGDPDVFYITRPSNGLIGMANVRVNRNELAELGRVLLEAAGENPGCVSKKGKP